MSLLLSSECPAWSRFRKNVSAAHCSGPGVASMTPLSAQTFNTLFFTVKVISHHRHLSRVAVSIYWVLHCISFLQSRFCRINIKNAIRNDTFVLSASSVNQNIAPLYHPLLGPGIPQTTLHKLSDMDSKS